MWMYLINQLHSDYFDNLNKVGNVANCLFVIDLYQFFAAYLHSNRGDVSFFAR